MSQPEHDHSDPEFIRAIKALNPLFAPEERERFTVLQDAPTEHLDERLDNLRDRLHGGSNEG